MYDLSSDSQFLKFPIVPGSEFLKLRTPVGLDGGPGLDGGRGLHRGDDFLICWVQSLVFLKCLFNCSGKFRVCVS